MRLDNLHIPKKLISGVEPQIYKPNLDTIIYGGDTETVDGRPNTIQLHNYVTGVGKILFVNADNACKQFIKFCDSLKNGYYTIYFHNLKFDLIELFYGLHHKFATDSYDFKIGDWSISGIYGNPTYCIIRKKHVDIKLLDSFSYFKSSLARAGELVCPDLPKLNFEKNVTGIITPTDKNAIEYALRDAEIVAHLGAAIKKIELEYQIDTTVSIADMAARIFKSAYLSTKIVQCPIDFLGPAIRAYHGGKTAIYVPPGEYNDITIYDISSAYPHAISTLPVFNNKRSFLQYNAKNPTVVPELGLYKISCELLNKKYTSLYNDEFKKHNPGAVTQWVNGCELNALLEYKIIRNVSVSGIFYETKNEKSDFCNFVNEFYEKKSSAASDINRHFYKIILNSLYGKFIQTRKTTTVECVDCDKLEISGGEKHHRAGGLFNPFLAGYITSHTRRAILNLEYLTNSIHTATDAVFTTKKYNITSDGLGGVAVDTAGDLSILRAKTYIVYKNSSTPTQKKVLHLSKLTHREIVKYAKHGYLGDLDDLELTIKNPAHEYKYTHVNKLKESINRELQINRFETRIATTKIQHQLGIKIEHPA